MFPIGKNGSPYDLHAINTRSPSDRNVLEKLNKRLTTPSVVVYEMTTSRSVFI
jgi:hypothetical protein